MKKLSYVKMLVLAVYVALYALLRAVNYIHIIGGVGLGGTGFQIECYWPESSGKPRFYTFGQVVLFVFRPCWKIECMMRRQQKVHSSTNKITGPNTGGPRQFPIPMPPPARVGQFSR